MALFSSVNVMFMLALILWITASFSLFYIGGLPKPLEPKLDEDKDGWTFDDLFMAVGILWNVAAAVYVMVPQAQRDSNIPLNNVVIAVVALSVSIVVQWRWANFRMFDIEGHEDAAEGVEVANVVKPEYVNQDTQGDQEGVYNDKNQVWGKLGDGPINYEDSKSSYPSHMLLNTANFMATANAVQAYGSKYARCVLAPCTKTHTIPSLTLLCQTGRYMAYGDGGLRQRRVHTKTADAARVGTRLASMPKYTAMVMTGKPFAIYNYVRNLQVRAGSEYH